MEATCNSPANVNIFGQHVRPQAPSRHGFLRVSLGERPTDDGFPIYVLAFWREYIYIADYATMVTDSRAYPERNGPPDPKTPEKGSALLSSTTSFLWRPHQQSLVHWAYKSPQLSGLPEPHVLSDVITRWSFVPQDNSLSARMFPSTSTRVTGLAEENTIYVYRSSVCCGDGSR